MIPIKLGDLPVWADVSKDGVEFTLYADEYCEVLITSCWVFTIDERSRLWRLIDESARRLNEP